MGSFCSSPDPDAIPVIVVNASHSGASLHHRHSRPDRGSQRVVVKKTVLRLHRPQPSFSIPMAFEYSLTTIDLPNLSMFVSIEDRFCRGLSTLTTLNLSGMAACETIGKEFCMDCTSLTSLDMSGMQACLTIGRSFCAGCTSLTHIDLSDMRSCRRVYDAFCHECTALVSLDMPGDRSMPRVGTMLDGCDSPWLTVYLPHFKAKRCDMTIEYSKIMTPLLALAAERNVHVGELELLAVKQMVKIPATSFAISLSVRSHWSWRKHLRSSPSNRTAALCLFQGVTFVDHHGDTCYLPGDIAWEICGFLIV